MWFVNCLLLMVGATAVVFGISFYLRSRKAQGNIKIYILLCGIFSALWCISYGLIGISDDFGLCAFIRRFGIIGINGFLLSEVFLVSEMSGAKKTSIRMARIFCILITIIDFFLFSQEGVDTFERYGNWTTWVANPDFSKIRTFHGIYILMIYLTLIHFALTWSRLNKIKRLRRFLRMVYIANYTMLFFTLPDTFLPILGVKAVATSGLGAAACTIVLWYGATQLISFDIRMGNIKDRLFDFIEAGVLVFDMDREPAAVNLFASQLIEDTDTETLHMTDFFDIDQETLDAMFRDAVDDIVSSRLWNRSGTNAYSLRLNAIKDDYGEPYCFMCVFVDVTEEVEAVSRFEVASLAKSRFLAQMSHEIRTPINAVLGMNEMILRVSKDEEILEYAGNISSSGNTLLTLINSILDFSKIEDGKMDITPVEYDTASFINDLVNSIVQRADGKGLELRVNIDPSLPCRLYGDDVRVSQVIMNLLTNAVKYTEKGTVTLTMRMVDHSEDTAAIFVSVKDTGIGIKEEDREKLFEAFERLDEIRNHNIEGTGLGISIVTSLLEMMGSRLNVESVYKEGSDFYFTIDQKIADITPIGDYEQRLKESRKSQKRSDLIHAPNARVLLVDDNEMNLKVASNFMKLCGIHPDMANSGKKAIEAMREHTYDIVFLDHMMPELDGIETLHEAGKEQLLPPGTVVIALTANAVVGAKEFYISKGFSDYLSKPMEINDLVNKLRQYLPEDAFEEIEEKNTSEVEVMEFAPVETEAFAEGKTRTAADEVVEFHPVEASDEASANEHAPKHSTSVDVMEFTPVETEPQSAGINFDRLAENGVDTEAGLNYCAGDEEFYAQMLGDFAGTFDERKQLLEEYFSEANWHEYEILVHALKSNLRTLGANALSEQAKALEDAAKNKDSAFIGENHTALIEGCEHLVGLLDK